MILSLSLSLSHSHLPSADKLKRMFGSTGGSGGGSSKPLVYDPGYATMDPVPHNTGSHSAFTPQISQAYHSGQFTGEEGLPTGARTLLSVHVHHIHVSSDSCSVNSE